MTTTPDHTLTRSASSVRDADPRVLPLFVDRWSPRAFDESTIPEEDLQTIFAAAGWAPSGYNVQPWKFLYARRGGPDWDRFLALLVPFNQSWAKDASALIFIVSDTLMGEGDEAKPSPSHSLDAGAAWAQLALQAHHMGYVTHGMSGVDFDRAREELHVPGRWRIEAAVAIGRQGDPARLADGLREREVPSGRKPVAQIAIAGNFA